MYKENKSRRSGREVAAERLPEDSFKQLMAFRRQCVEKFGRRLGRLRVAEQFDRFFWRDAAGVEAWLEMSPQARNRRLQQFDYALGQQARVTEQRAEAEAQLRSLVADNDDQVEVTGDEGSAAVGASRAGRSALPEQVEPDEGDGLSVEGFIVRFGRPRRREDCPDYRPCPYVSCRYHLYLDVTRRGRLRMNFPEHEVIDLPMSCALDIASEGPKTLEEIGRIMGGISRERVRQIEQAALNALRVRGGDTLVDFLSERTAESEAANFQLPGDDELG